MTPSDVIGLTSGVTDVALGGAHTCAVTAVGGVKCWGYNTIGQVGDGTLTNATTPVDVFGLTSGVMAISAAGDTTCAVTDSGGVKCWGWNYYGQLGDGTTANNKKPRDVIGVTNAVAVSVGKSHACAVTATGGVQCWGYNAYGQLGNGTTTNSSIPVNVTGLSSGAASVSAGRDHACAVTAAGGLKCWGRNQYSQLGSDLPAGSVTAVAAGSWYTCVRNATGGLQCWGNNSKGQLGNGTTANSGAPVDVVGFPGGSALTVQPPMVNAGVDQTIDEGTLVIVNATFTDDGGGNHTAVIDWGNGSAITSAGVNQAGGAATGSYDYPSEGVFTVTVTVTDDTGLSGSDSLVVTVNGASPSSPVVNAGADQAVDEGATVVVSATFADDDGSPHTATIDWGDGSAVTNAGVNEAGGAATGSRDYPSAGVFTITVTVTDDTGLSGSDSLVVTVANASSTGDAGVSVAVGVDHTCAVTSAGGLQCWGRNDYGQLGIGTTSRGATSTPVDVAALGNGVAAVDADLAHTCALTRAGGVKCWGFNGGDYVPTPVDVSGLASGAASISVGGWRACAVTTAGEIKCWDPPYGTATTPAEAGGTGFAGVSAGSNHTCAVKTSGAVLCWGSNFGGRLGSGLSSEFAGVEAGLVHTCALTTTGGVKCWGYNAGGELGNGTTVSSSTPVDVIGLSSGVVAISAGRNHTCALTTSGAVKCWGQNTRSELGDGTTTARSVPVDVVGLSGDIAAVAAGGRFTCALTTTGGIQCWGNNYVGQLGNGTTAPNKVPPIVIGPVDVVGYPTGSASTSSDPVAPVVNAGADQALDLGVLAVINATFTDDNGGGTFTATIDWGDGSPIANAALGAGGAATGSYDYPGEGVVTATVTITDNTGLSGSDSLVITVTKPPAVSPQVDAGIDVSVGEGTPLALSFGFADVAWETHDALVVWGDGGTATATVDQSLDTAIATHTYMEQGVFTVLASVSDDVGLSGVDTLTVTVLNVAPNVTPTTGLSVGDASTFAVVLATFTDDGASDTHTAIVDWGDGTVEAAIVDQDAGTVSGTHPFYLLGAHVATVTVTDDDGAYTTVEVPFQVFNGPAVPGVTGWGRLLLGTALLALVVHQRRRVLVRQHTP